MMDWLFVLNCKIFVNCLFKLVKVVLLYVLFLIIWMYIFGEVMLVMELMVLCLW